MLICTFADKEKIMAAYKMAVDNRMRFFSYGDCMLLK
jgi:S-adenosylmethionine:tRNA ribosyltransferase-isomerase